MDLENLNKDKKNYERYLQRMTTSISSSSKGLIPLFCKGTVLDVGCGSGILMNTIKSVNPDLKVIGIDINSDACKVCEEQGLEVYKMNLEDFYKTGKKVDTVVFSSILHEIYSYTEDDSYGRYDISSVFDQLGYAKKILNEDGILIIRDGVAPISSISPEYIIIKDESIIPLLKEFFKKHEDKLGKYIPLSITDNKNGTYTASASNHMIKEFLYTITWGPESFTRESEEIYGFATKSVYNQLLRSSGFRINNVMTSSEKYIDYLSKYIEIDCNVINMFNESTIFIVAEKWSNSYSKEENIYEYHGNQRIG